MTTLTEQEKAYNRDLYSRANHRLCNDCPALIGDEDPTYWPESLATGVCHKCRNRKTVTGTPLKDAFYPYPEDIWSPIQA